MNANAEADVWGAARKRDASEITDPSVDGERAQVEADSTTESQESQYFGTGEHKTVNKLKQKHNKKEKIRRQSLKDSIHSLRNQLRIHKTKRATTISILKSARLEIHDLKSSESKQQEVLSTLKACHDALVQRLSHLRSGLSLPQENRPEKDINTPNSSPALIQLPPDAAPPPLAPSSSTSSTVPPPYQLPLLLPGPPYLSTAMGYCSVPFSMMLTSSPIHPPPLQLNTAIPWYSPLRYSTVTAPASGLGLPLPYPVYSRLGVWGLTPEASTMNSRRGAECGGRSPSVSEEEEVMVDIEGDGGDELQGSEVDTSSYKKLSKGESELNATGQKQHPNYHLTPSPPVLTSSGADMDIILVEDITDKFHPVRTEFLQQALSKSLGSKDDLGPSSCSKDDLVPSSGSKGDLVPSRGSKDDQAPSSDSCTVHTSIPHKPPYPIYVGLPPFPSLYSYGLL